MSDRFDKDGNYKIFKNVKLPDANYIYKMKMFSTWKKMKVGDSIKAETVYEAAKLRNLLYARGFKIRQYKTSEGFVWIQRTG